MIGVLSDTHGLVCPEVFEILQGVELIIHAGDIGGADVIDALERIAPVKAVRGNNDRESWADHVPYDQVVEYDRHTFYVLHQLEHLDLDPTAAGISAVVYGHSHRPAQELRQGVWYLNPGSAGPRRFSLPIALAKIHMTSSGLVPELIEIPRYVPVLFPLVIFDKRKKTGNILVCFAFREH